VSAWKGMRSSSTTTNKSIESTVTTHDITSDAHKLDFAGRPFRMAVVGAGPAGFYAASRLLALPGSDKVRVDMYEELPVPFGLVRYGVAPDHPEVKNCIHKFEETAQDPRFRFFGNVQIGGPASGPTTSTSTPPDPTNPDPGLHPHLALAVPLSFLRPFYDSVLFTYGASSDRTLGPSVRNDNASTLTNVLSARSFVHWYNGHPHSPFHSGAQKLDLSSLNTASIIGHGNVALDCARILLSGAAPPTVDRLAKTDVPESVLAELAKSNISKVELVGRRGPLQFAGTTKEMRELVTLDPKNVAFTMSPEDRNLVDTGLAELDAFAAQGGKADNARMKKRLLGLMQKANTSTAVSAGTDKKKEWSLVFCQSPVAILGKDGSASGPVQCVQYELNDLVPPSNDLGLVDPSIMVARGAGKTTERASDLVLKSVGYRSVGIEGLPFDDRKGVVRNIDGRVQEADGTQIPGMYVCGWLARGPNGVIATTMFNAFQTAETIARDFLQTAGSGRGDHLAELPDLHKQGFGSGDERVVSWTDWQAIDAEERRIGSKLGKEREKFVQVADMIKVLG